VHFNTNFKRIFGSLMERITNYTSPSAIFILSFLKRFLLFSLLACCVAGSNATELTGSMVKSRMGHSITSLVDGKVLVAGGISAWYGASYAELFDPQTGSFVLTGAMQVARSGHAAALLADGRVLVVGGATTDNRGNNITLASTEIFDPVSGTWTLSPSMQNASATPIARTLADGRIMVINYKNGATSAEVFDPISFGFSAAGNLITSRSGFTATALADGKLLVAGGLATGNTSTILNSAELWDPATSTWLATGNMGAARMNAAASLLADGKVLLTGGIGNGASTAISEIYDPVSGSL